MCVRQMLTRLSYKQQCHSGLLIEDTLHLNSREGHAPVNASVSKPELVEFSEKSSILYVQGCFVGFVQHKPAGIAHGCMEDADFLLIQQSFIFQDLYPT